MFERLSEDIDSIMARDPAARSGWEVLTCYPGLHALMFHRWANACWINHFKWLGRFLAHIGRILTGIEIHPGAVIGRRVFIDHGFGVVIGETAVVGDDCTIYQGVTLGGTSLYKGEKRHPTLEDGVIVGAGAQILGSFTVGAGAKIGSNAVVVKPVPAGATAVGNPARVVIKKPEAEEDIAARLFAAYGLTVDGTDPVSKALESLVRHAQAQEKQITSLIATLKCNGVPCESLPEYERECAQGLDKLVD